jgi:hypothetical protein
MEPAASIVGLLGAGATALAKRVLTGAVRDAYAALRDRLKSHYPSVDIDLLEKNPESRARRAIIEEDLTAAGADRDAELISLAQKVAVALKGTTPSDAATIGVDLSALTAADIYLGDITAGRDVRISGIVSGSGNIVIGTNTKGVEPAEPWPQAGKPRK